MDDIKLCEKCNGQYYGDVCTKCKKKKRNIIIILCVIFFAFFISFSNADLSTKDEDDGVVDVNPQEISFDLKDLTFTYNSYVEFPTINEEKNVIIFDVNIKNNGTSQTYVTTSYFTLHGNSKYDVYTSLDYFFYSTTSILAGDSIDLQIMFRVPTSETELSLETDISILSLGKEFKLNELIDNTIDEYYEYYYFKLNGIYEKDFDFLLSLIKGGMVTSFNNIIVDDSDSEIIYGLDSNQGNLTLIANKNGLYDLLDIHYFYLYKDSVKNEKYVYNSVITSNQSHIITSINDVISSTIVDGSCSNYKFYRDTSSEDSIVVTCVVSGKNGFGLTIYKDYEFYYTYNFEKSLFEITNVESN